MQIVEKPQVIPMCCRVCQGGPDRTRTWFVDTEVTEEYYGAVYYCKICAEEFARLIGYVDGDSVAEVNTLLLLEVEMLKTRLTAYEQFVRTIIDSNYNAELLSRAVHPCVPTEESVGTQQALEFDSGKAEHGSNEPLHDKDVGELSSSKFDFS